METNMGGELSLKRSVDFITFSNYQFSETHLDSKSSGALHATVEMPVAVRRLEMLPQLRALVECDADAELARVRRVLRDVRFTQFILSSLFSFI